MHEELYGGGTSDKTTSSSEVLWRKCWTKLIRDLWLFRRRKILLQVWQTCDNCWLQRQACLAYSQNTKRFLRSQLGSLRQKASQLLPSTTQTCDIQSMGTTWSSGWDWSGRRWWTPWSCQWLRTGRVWREQWGERWCGSWKGSWISFPHGRKTRWTFGSHKRLKSYQMTKRVEFALEVKSLGDLCFGSAQCPGLLWPWTESHCLRRDHWSSFG